ncbi:MAG: pirin family protein [Polyangiales bacterium]
MSPRSLSRRQVLASGLALPALAALHACRSESAPREPALVTRRPREVTTRIDAQPTIEGAGVHLRRSLGSSLLPLLDPFLMLDEFHSDRPEDYLKGFPSHPHRGFETVTYMLEGAMEHRDSLGNHGRLVAGSTQWMTAGRGIIHSEMPQQERGLMWGFQLWVNLPAARKMTAPRYQDLAPERITEVATNDGALVRVVAGESSGKRGPVEGIVTAPQMMDVKLAKGGRFEQPVPLAHNAFAYVVEGALVVGDKEVRVTPGQLAVLSSGDLVSMTADEPARFLLLSAQPIGEPVRRHGPFVMNTDEELQQAVDDYRSGRLVSG